MNELDIKSWRDKKKWFIFLCTFSIISFVYFLVLSSTGKFENESIYLSNSMIVLYAIINLLVNENRSYSCRKMFYLFIFFFMGIAPIMQYKNGTEAVGGYKITETTYLITNFLIIFALVVFDISYFISYKKIKYHNFGNKYFLNSKTNTEPSILGLSIILISLACTFLVIYLNKSTPLLLVLRGLSDFQQEETKYLGPIFGVLIKPLPILCCITYLCIGKKKYLKIILIIFALISNFPTSLSRLRLAAYYMPIIIILFPKLRYKNRFIYLFIIGFLLIFPFMNNFRTWGESDFKWYNLGFDMFCNMNYDSYQSFAFIVQNDEITNGKQLLSTIFFWIPRIFWEDKPYFTGIYMADKYNLWFSQIAINYFGEGYVNFGLLGVFLFAIILGWITAKFDKGYWFYGKGSIHSLFAPFYLIFMGMYFFFMRGDLMYGFQYTLGLLLGTYFIYIVVKHSLKN